ncbi:toprim domain-containing protein [Siphonobacter curvatus]|uniref:DNA primase n=1 Tax=Siphonobacter curvatus TaxID=2094562 RepID=A0A2S7IF35_9BACT|nr:toprim domain-containing protein [Siphonobacter curvatus]PQA53408.1 hypothetical protein C5O19_24490 [Siphonobacter curvatus]
MTFQQAKALSLVGFLEKYYAEPTYIRGQNYWYVSPLRAERTPSFKVDNRLNLWYDHGLGKGGTIIDLGCLLWKCSPRDVLEKLAEGADWPERIPVSAKAYVKRPGLVIQCVGELSDARLLAYAQSRMIAPAMLRRYCQQISYQLNGKTYRAIGFKNDRGGYELRSPYFKGSSSPKSYTHLQGGHPQLLVLEGFMDFLSVVTYFQHLPLDVLVLNSLALLEKASPVLGSYTRVILLLDNDAAGEKATRQVQARREGIIDARVLLGSAKDVNECLMNHTPANATRDESVRR